METDTAEINQLEAEKKLAIGLLQVRHGAITTAQFALRIVASLGETKALKVATHLKVYFKI